MHNPEYSILELKERLIQKVQETDNVVFLESALRLLEFADEDLIDSSADHPSTTPANVAIKKADHEGPLL